MKAEDKLALALSGWLLGADHAIPQHLDRPVGLPVRELAGRYLTEGLKLRRTQASRVARPPRKRVGGQPGLCPGRT